MQTLQPTPEQARTIVFDCFLPSQRRTPLSGGSNPLTAEQLILSGIPLAVIANTDLGPDVDSELFNDAVAHTLSVHETAGATPFTSEERVKARMPEAFRINMAVALRVAISAATGLEFDEVLSKVDANDPRLATAQQILDTEQGRRDTLAVLAVIQQEATLADAGAEMPLDEAYRRAQLAQESEQFPGRLPFRERRDTNRERLMAHLTRRLASLAISTTDPRVRAAVHSFLNQDRLDPESLHLGPPPGADSAH